MRNNQQFFTEKGKNIVRKSHYFEKTSYFKNKVEVKCRGKIRDVLKRNKLRYLRYYKRIFY